MQRAILVIDPDLHSVESIVDCSELDITLVHSLDVEDAYVAFEQIDCIGVIIDTELCGLNSSFEFIRVIKDDSNGWPEVPVMVWSKDINPGVVAYCWSLGVNECFRKPSDPSLLLRAIDSIMYKD